VSTVVVDPRDARAQRHLANQQLQAAALAFAQTGDAFELERLASAARKFGRAHDAVSVTHTEIRRASRR
jgi:hypothetical protein